MNASSGYRPERAAGVMGAAAEHRELGAAYSVSLAIFEGPLDLLLHLIEQEKLDINEVSLVAVTDQYLRTIEAMERPAPGALADFLVVASRLLYIKSAHLLPKPLSADDEDEDAGATLVRHLLEYRQFKRVADELRTRESELRAFVRPANAIELPELTARETEFGELDMGLLHKALQKALLRIADKPKPTNVQPYTVTVAERMAGIRQRLTLLGAGTSQLGAPFQLAFDDLLAEVDSRLAIIVTFLAVLELMKQQELWVVQESTFGEILLVRFDAEFASARADGATPELASAAEEQEGATEETRTGEAEQSEDE